MRIFFAILILISPIVALAQEPKDKATEVHPGSREHEYDWQQARKITLNTGLFGIEQSVVRGSQRMSLHPAELKKGATGKLTYSVLTVLEILNDEAVVLMTGGGYKFALEGYPSNEMSKGDTVVILDPIRSSGDKDVRTFSGTPRHIDTVKILSVPEVIQFEEGLKKKGLVILYLKDGERFFGKVDYAASTKNTIAIILDSKDVQYFAFEDFREDTQKLLTDGAKKPGHKLPTAAKDVVPEIKDLIIPVLDIANIYTELKHRGFAMQKSTKASDGNSLNVRWQKAGHRIDFIELDGGVSKITLVVTLNAKPPAEQSTDDDRDIVRLIGSVNYDHAFQASNGDWAVDNIESRSSMQEDRVIFETFSQGSARALVIRRAKLSEVLPIK